MSSSASRRGRGVEAAPVRAHLQTLLEGGGTYQSIARVSGVGERTLRSLTAGRFPSVYRPTADRIFAVEARQVASPLRIVHGEPTRRRVAELLEGGWQKVDIARYAGLSPSTLTPQNLASGVSLRTHVAVRRAWLELRARDGTKPRPYPRLTGPAAEMATSELAQAAGVCRSTARRAQLGLPMTRQSARKVSSALVMVREARRSRLHDAA